MAKIKARRHRKQRIYIHNNLSNDDFYFKKIIESRLQKKDEEGIAFDYMAYLVLSAFAFEACINFLGKKPYCSVVVSDQDNKIVLLYGIKVKNTC